MNNNKATAIAHSNIALAKYWGRRDEKLTLPNQSSVSMTLDRFFTTTTVEFKDSLLRDELVLNHHHVHEGTELKWAIDHLDRIRTMAKISTHAHVRSTNNFPTAAGLASSASGFAALSMAGAKAAGLHLNEKELSMLARQGSGSASRSIHGGFVRWNKGERADGSDSFAEQVAASNHWPELRMIVNILSTRTKKWKSREGMANTVESCPYYPAWVKSAEEDTQNAVKAIQQRDFAILGPIVQANALKMHATMIASQPMMLYWDPLTVRLMHEIETWRMDEGIQAYFTMDAGPQVKVLCLEKDEKELVRRLSEIQGIHETVVCKNGPAARLIEEHLF